mmetsp:Transcript_18906/g.32283  ORF Transcript_18906/g.32283 Transcript_18906/m.32283 type:complete len:89 (-) Transcript_18906:76-342(-)
MNHPVHPILNPSQTNFTIDINRTVCGNNQFMHPVKFPNFKSSSGTSSSSGVFGKSGKSIIDQQQKSYRHYLVGHSDVQQYNKMSEQRR